MSTEPTFEIKCDKPNCPHCSYVWTEPDQMTLIEVAQACAKKSGVTRRQIILMCPCFSCAEVNGVLLACDMEKRGEVDHFAFVLKFLTPQEVTKMSTDPNNVGWINARSHTRADNN